VTTDWPAVHREVVETFAKSWAHPGQDAWGEILTDDVELNQPMLPRAHGRKMWQKEGARLLALLPDMRGEVLSWAGREDILFIELELSGTLGGRPLAFRSIARFFFAAGNAVCGEVLRNRRSVERFDTQAQVVEIGTSGGSCTPGRASIIGRHDVYERTPGTQLRELALPQLDTQAQHIKVEALERGRVSGAQHDVVEAEDRKRCRHGGLLH